jgi:hypothetical protein
MESNVVATPASEISPDTDVSVWRVRWTTGLLCAAFMAGGVALHSIRYVNEGHRFGSVAGFVNAQVDVLGFLGTAFALVTLCFGLFYARGLAARADFSPRHVRAVHMTLAVATLTTIVLHVAAIVGGTSFGVSAARLLVPFVWPDRFPDPMAAGVLGLWLLAAFGLSYFIRGRLGGHRRWRILHRVVIAGVALSILHTVLLSGWIAGWAL